jgi:hypothetical protein
VVEKEGSSSSGVDAEQSGVRRRRLLQIGGRARENKRGKWGGGGRLSAVWRKENGRERAPGSAVGSTDRRVRMASGNAVEGGSARSRWRQAGKQGRAAGRGQRDVAWLTGGAEGQRGPVVSSVVQKTSSCASKI